MNKMSRVNFQLLQKFKVYNIHYKVRNKRLIGQTYYLQLRLKCYKPKLFNGWLRKKIDFSNSSQSVFLPKSKTALSPMGLKDDVVLKGTLY